MVVEVNLESVGTKSEFAETIDEDPEASLTEEGTGLSDPDESDCMVVGHFLDLPEGRSGALP